MTTVLTSGLCQFVGVGEHPEPQFAGLAGEGDRVDRTELGGAHQLSLDQPLGELAGSVQQHLLYALVWNTAHNVTYAGLGAAGNVTHSVQ